MDAKIIHANFKMLLFQYFQDAHNENMNAIIYFAKLRFFSAVIIEMTLYCAKQPKIYTVKHAGFLTISSRKAILPIFVQL